MTGAPTVDYSVNLRPLAAGNSCPCGSGETFARCCGRDGLPLASMSPLNPDALLPAIQTLPAEDAIRQCRTLLHLSPGHVPTLEYLAQLLRASANPAAAVEPLARLAQLEPGNHQRHADIAGLYYDLRRLPEAVRSVATAAESQRTS